RRQVRQEGAARAARRGRAAGGQGGGVVSSVLDLADRSWPVLRRLVGGHTAIYKATNGAIGHRFPGAPPMLLLEHVGAKSGTKRTTQLVYVANGNDELRVVSNDGYPKSPAWFH